jgi:hypothetical protein
MELYEVVLFLHITAAVLTFGVAAVMHVLLARLRSATDVRQVRDQMPLLKGLGPLFPVGALLILAFGAYLVQIADDGEGISWSDGWVIAAIVGLVAMEAVGGAVIARREKVLHDAVEAAPDGPVSGDIAALIHDKGIWYGSHFATAEAFGIVLLMTTKPSGVTSALVLVVAGLIGVASAVPFLRTAPVVLATSPG